MHIEEMLHETSNVLHACCTKILAYAFIPCYAIFGRQKCFPQITSWRDVMKHRLLALCSAGLLALSMSMIAYPNARVKFEVMQ